MKTFLIMLFASIFLASCSSNGENEEENTDINSLEEMEEAEVEEVSPEPTEENPNESLNEENANDVEPVIHQEVFEREGEEVEIEVTVHPIEREAGVALLTVEFEKISGTANVDLHDMISHPATPRTSNHAVLRGNAFDRLGYNVRLIDPINYTVSHTLFYQDYQEDLYGDFLKSYAIVSEDLRRSDLNDNEVVSYSAIFNAPVEDTVHVMLESFDFIPDVPVIDSDYVVDTANELLEENLSDHPNVSLEDLAEQVYPLQTYSESTDVPVGTLVEEAQATVTLDADVLFEFGSADLGEEADEIIEATAEELQRSDGGELLIEGHTDNNGSDELNQGLSEDRAQSVFDRLEEVMNLDLFDNVETVGRSFHEPIASNDSEEGQALNRRVEFHFTPPAEMVEVESEEIELPESLGPEMTYDDSEMLDITFSNNRDYSVSVESLTRMDGFIIGRIRVRDTGGGYVHIHSPVNIGHGHGARSIHIDEDIITSGDTLDTYDANGITLIYGDRRIFPIDYMALTVSDTRDKGEEELVPLTHRNVHIPPNTLEEDDSIVVTIVWPDIPAETVTVDKGVSDNYEGDLNFTLKYLVPWRITDVPVTGEYETNESLQDDYAAEGDS